MLTQAIPLLVTASLLPELDPVIGPTVGFSAPVKRHLNGIDLVFFDLGGGNRIRGVWPNYFPDVRDVPSPLRPAT